MRLNRRIKIQLVIFAVVSLVAGSVMVFGYMKLPRLIGVDTYPVTLELRSAGGLYERALVTYRGTEVGQVKSVNLDDNGVRAVLALKSGVDIPSNLTAEVHSQSAIGEQYVALLPRDSDSPPLRKGDIIDSARASVPPDINDLLSATNQGLTAIPGDNLKTVIDESYQAVGGLGPELSRIVDGSTALATDAKRNLAELTNVIDNGGALADTQTDTADSIQSWAGHLAEVTRQVEGNDNNLRGVLNAAPSAAREVAALFDRLTPTLPVVAANFASVNQVAVAYNPSIEQMLVLLPQGLAVAGATYVPGQSTNQRYKGSYQSFNLNQNLPPPCTTGYLPAQQRRSPIFEDSPEPPAGDLYCRIPQNSDNSVRGARNYPCVTKPGKRAPTAKMCESDEQYVPLNDGYNWKGDPNATTTGQSIPQPPSAAPPAPIAVAEYDPATGEYIGPDGKVYRQADLANTAPADKTWQSMLIPGG
ncbi:Uncharacterised protein [Mycolicibacterium vanbaalenii]|uniref:Uncharacterized protein n=1 Tax=Mycolicibacterium vanbaalenii TaxID=110539 RepID=A0A5S9RAL0_MYCVN|nr:MlaD family protein [Mycolicibacterium vanbaalenii]CAA0137640.1 Uncharacterised protein [Mycolicibacterium vanbaalenii]